MDDDSEYEIAITTECGHIADPGVLLRSSINAALTRHQVRTARISVAIVDDSRIAQLNSAHLDHEGPTDVLSFDLRDQIPPGDAKEDGGVTFVEGEIVVSLDTATRQADRLGHSVHAELALYAVHGVLHLLGYDDAGRVDAERMHEVEDEILGSLGLGSVYRGLEG